LRDDFGIRAFVDKQAVRVVKDCGGGVLEETAIECSGSTALGEEAA